MGHLEDPALTTDLTVARDFDLGMTGPPLSISMDFIAGGLVEMIGGLASAAVLVAYAWWAPLVLGGAWLATHWLLRESAVWRDRNTDEVRERAARRRLRLPARGRSAGQQGAASVRPGRLDDRALRRAAHDAARAAVPGHAPARAAGGLEPAARHSPPTSSSSGRWRRGGASGSLDLGGLVVFAQCAVGTSLIAFGGLNWALDGAAAPVAAVLRLEPAMAPAGALPSGQPAPRTACPAREIRFRDVTFAYPGGAPVLEGFDLTIPAGSSLAIVGQNGAGKTTLAKLLCRLYDPQSARSKSTASTCASSTRVLALAR